MKRHLSIFLALLTFVSFASAQLSLDPDDDFYFIAQSWELRGVVSSLPPMRPYPLGNIKAILEEAIEKGNERDKQIAQDYWQQVTGKSWTLSLSASATGKIESNRSESDNSFDPYFILEPKVAGDHFFYKDMVSMGYSAGIAAFSSEPDEMLPIYTNIQTDTLADPATVGPADCYLDFNDVLALGKKNVFIQAGIFRSGWGPFIDQGLSLNDSSFHRTGLSFTYTGEKLSYTQLFAAIAASHAYDGSGLLPNKFLAFHAIEFSPVEKISLAYYENIVYGKRFEPAGFLPVPYMISEELTGSTDNVQMGLMIKFKPFSGFLWTTDLFIDDFDIDEIVKLNIDSKNRLGFMNGFIYAPEDSFCSQLSLNYVIITPYTYSHWDYDSDTSSTISPATYSYQNYTNNSIPMGSAIPPNSDALTFRIEFRPKKNLTVSVDTRFMRHANVCESLTDDEAITYLLADEDVYATDGSIYNHANFANEGNETGTHVDTAWDHLNFLSQDHKMYVFQAGLNAKAHINAFKKTKLSLNFGYTFEYIRNKGVDANMFPGGKVSPVKNADTITGYTYNGKTYSTSEADKKALVEDVRKEWEAALYDVINNYFTLGFTLKF